MYPCERHITNAAVVELDEFAHIGSSLVGIEFIDHDRRRVVIKNRDGDI